MHVRTATAADAPRIALIHVETWRAAYRGHVPDAVLNALSVERRTAFFQERLAQTRGRLFVAEEGAGIVGYCDLIPSRDKDADSETVAEIAAIYILPAHWRKGVGRALCRSALAEAGSRGYHAVTLWILASNIPARHFYEAMGFRLDGDSKTDKATDGTPLHEIRFRKAIMRPSIRQAGPADAETVSGILREAAQWLEQNGMAMWRDDELVSARIVADVDAGLFFVAERAGVAAGVVKFQLEDSLFWPDVPPGLSAFVHRLAVSRQFAGGGISSALLRWAVERTRSLGRNYLRLDCEASRPRLRAVYERFGFRHHSDRQVGPYFVSRYECDVTHFC